MKTFIKKASEELKGDWILIGGSLLPLLDIDTRVTVDIDFAPIGKTDQQLELLKIAEKMSLPIEVINSACSFYINEINDVKSQSILLLENSKCCIYRPNFNLYLQLKLNRATESDIADCLNYAKYCAINDTVDWDKAHKIINKKISSSVNKKTELQPLNAFIQKMK